MESIRKLVLSFFKKLDTLTPQQQFNEALMLLGKYPNKQSLRFYNRAGYSTQRLDAILYDLKKAAAINDQELIKSKAVTKKPKKVAKKLVTTGAEPPLPVRVQEALKQNDSATAGFKLVILYPFIESEDCPDELKVLVTDMMTAYRGFIMGQEELSDLIYGNPEKGIEPKELTNEELFDLGGDLVKNWELNELIHQELSYYGEHGEILGKHPKLVALALKESISKKSDKKLLERLKQLKKNISNNEDKLKVAKDDSKKSELLSRIDQYNQELNMVQAELEIRKKDAVKE